MEQTDKEKIASLERSLFYESQYRSAIISDAICHYDANLTKDLIEKEIFYKSEEGSINSSLKLVGLSAPCKFSEFINKWVTSYINPEYANKYEVFYNTKDFLINSYNQGNRDYTIEYWYTNAKGKELFLSQRFLLTKNEVGDICTLAVLTNTTHAKRIEAQHHKDELEKHAYYDPITNGYNYIKFKKELLNAKTPGSIISIDIHAFKLINTTFGIGIGDKVIKAIWDRIEEVFDFTNGDFAAHINADDFIVFCSSEDKDEIITKIKSISYSLNLISAELSLPQVKLYFGISSWNPEKTIELSYSEAVTAKNNAKKLQDSDYAFFEKEDMDRLVWEENIIENFENAMAQNEFHVWYQPKYNPETHEMIGAEALVRWIKNGQFFVSPGEFIPLFENSGLIRNFDQYIFRTVCMQQKKWQDEGKKIIPVSINLSPISLYYKDIINIYSHIAESVGIDKKFVPIEITETAAVTNSKFKEITDGFINAGFVLHMDDFGSGYSSLSTLNTIHFSAWKLDKSLIDSIGNYNGERLIHHIIQLAKELGIHITAEGVETIEQNNFLTETGCESIQGYYYSKPVDITSFEKLMI
ncbi:MAG: EAL domain-containing protein [Spirochaetales bacterium]|nr:EAL domain-containing protein [Spirochaetales bacterium]